MQRFVVAVVFFFTCAVLLPSVHPAALDSNGTALKPRNFIFETVNVGRDQNNFDKREENETFVVPDESRDRRLIYVENSNVNGNQNNFDKREENETLLTPENIQQARNFLFEKVNVGRDQNNFDKREMNETLMVSGTVLDRRAIYLGNVKVAGNQVNYRRPQGSAQAFASGNVAEPSGIYINQQTFGGGRVDVYPSQPLPDSVASTSVVNASPVPLAGRDQLKNLVSLTVAESNRIRNTFPQFPTVIREQYVNGDQFNRVKRERGAPMPRPSKMLPDVRRRFRSIQQWMGNQ